MKKTLTVSIAVILSILFAYAAYNKLKIYPTFVSQLTTSPITKHYAQFLSWFVPGTEMIIVGLLLFSRTRLVGLYSSFFLMLAFTIYIYLLLHFTSYMPCGCGGIINGFTWSQHLWFNVIFTALAGTGVVLFASSQQKKIA